MGALVNYSISGLQDSTRWSRFEFRPGDIVISTPPKCGTSWTQMLCGLLLFDGPDFPGSIDDLSPWLDLNFRMFIEHDGAGMPAPTLQSLLHHLDTAWQLRHQPNIAMFHYADYQQDL